MLDRQDDNIESAVAFSVVSKTIDGFILDLVSQVQIFLTNKL